MPIESDTSADVTSASWATIGRLPARAALQVLPALPRAPLPSLMSAMHASCSDSCFHILRAGSDVARSPLARRMPRTLRLSTARLPPALCAAVVARPLARGRRSTRSTGIGALARSVACGRAAGCTYACRPRMQRRVRCPVRDEVGRGVREVRATVAARMRLARAACGRNRRAQGHRRDARASTRGDALCMPGVQPMDMCVHAR